MSDSRNRPMEENKNEKWLPIPGLNGFYSVSSFGRIRSEPRILRRSSGSLYTVKERIIRTACANSGYPVPTFVAYSMDGKRTLSVHRAVALAFIGPCPEGHEVRHLDGDPANNHVGNLVYGTKVENEADKIRHGTSNRGSRNGMSKLLEKDVLEIRRMAGTHEDAAKLFGISSSLVCMIRSGRRWAWVSS